MKRKIGKIVVPLLALMIVAVGLIGAVLYTPAFATPIGDVRTRMGNFTGPVNGTEQDDNVKASLDLLHTLIGPVLTKGTGEVYYVDSGASGGATGLDWTNAAVTLDAGVGLCTADRGDTIIVAAGHAETIIIANGVDCDLAGITIVGLGVGENRPMFTMNHANAEFVIGADDVSIYNLEFIAHITAVAHCIDVETLSENFIIENCRFSVDVDATDEFVDTITVAATGTDGGLIKDCLFRSGLKSNAGPQSAINFIDCNDLHIIGNEFHGDYASACIQNETTAANNILIKDNLLFNGIIGGEAGLNAVECIELVATTTGMIVNNSLFCNVVTPDLAIVGADMFLSGNTYSESEGGSADSTPIGTVTGQTYSTTCTTSAMTIANGYDQDDDPAIFTVTGDIMARAVAYATTQLTSTSNDTVTLGVTGDTACLLLSDVVDGTAFDVNFCWTLTQAPDTTSAEIDAEWVMIPGGLDIKLFIDDHGLTAGVMVFYLQWIPLSEGATVVAAAP